MVRIFLLCCALFCVSCDSKHRTPPANVKVVELHGCNETDIEISMDCVIGNVSYGPGYLGPEMFGVMLTPIEIDKDFRVYVDNYPEPTKSYLANIPHSHWDDVIDIAIKFKVIYREASGLQLEIYDSTNSEAKPIKVVTNFEITPWTGPFISGIWPS